MPLLVRGGGGGKNTKDATATPQDVASGKIFYNNQGRQEGTGELLTYSQRTYDTDKLSGMATYPIYNEGFSWFRMWGKKLYPLGGNTGFLNYTLKASLPNSKIKGFIYNGEKFLIDLEVNTDSAIAFNDNDSRDFYNIDYRFVLYKNNIYFRHTKGRTVVTILY